VLIHADAYSVVALIALTTTLALTAILYTATTAVPRWRRAGHLRKHLMRQHQPRLGLPPRRQRASRPGPSRRFLRRTMLGRALRRRRRPGSWPGIGDDYGLLRTLALVNNLDTGQSVRALLSAGGVRATVATGGDGLVRVLVFPEEYDRARRLVSWVL
jgi:hypothetical protein